MMGSVGTAVRQARVGFSRPSISTSHAKQEPIMQPVGIAIPALVAAFSNGSPGVASTVTLLGRKWMVTVIG